MSFSRSFAAALCASAVATSVVVAQTSASAANAVKAARPMQTMAAARRSDVIRLDGKLDEAAWQAAPASNDFVQAFPKAGQPPTERTEVRVLYDDAAIYVGVRMFDAHPDSIANGLGRRDATAATGIYSDWIHVIIDSYHDRRTAFRFSTNPRGVQKDVYTYNDGNEDLNWDAVWEVSTSIDSLGWVAEYRIPLSQLRFGPAPANGVRTWGFQVHRDIARRNERATWSPWSPQDGAFVSRFGELTGLEGIHAPQRLEVLPYVSNQITRAPGNPANPFYSATKQQPKIGADIKYGLPGGLTLSATVNPDFGQVEVDPAVVNLSAFEVSFPEKRPFFLEGSDVFAFGQYVRQNDYAGQTFLYSRRIGRPPQLGVPVAASFVDTPENATIATAAKITGKNRGWTIGLLDAVTTEQNARAIAPSSGAEFQRGVEPATNYFASRVKRDFRGGQSFLGGMVQNTHRSVSDSIYTLFLRENANFGGIDFEHDINRRSWIFSGFAAGSQVTGSRNAIAITQRSSSRFYNRPDQDYARYDTTRTSLAGFMSGLAVQKNGTWFGSLALKTASPGFEINDLGQQNRVDYAAVSALYGYQSFKAGKRFRNWNMFTYSNDVWNYGGTPIFHALALGGNATLTNLWNFGGNVNASPNYYNDKLLRGGPLAKQPSQFNASAYLNTDSRKRITGSISGSTSRDEAGGWSRSLFLGADTRPASNVHFNIGPNLSRNHSLAQYVRTAVDPLATTTYGRRYVFANLDQTTLSLDTRFDVTFTPKLSFTMYAQPFVSAGRYTQFKEFLTPGEFEFGVFGAGHGTITPQRNAQGVLLGYTADPDGSGAAPSFSIGNPDFNVRSLRGNAVLRWDYRPGSAIFLVWQQQRSDFEPYGEFSAGHDVGEIFRTVPTNVLLVKATWWLAR